MCELGVGAVNYLVVVWIGCCSKISCLLLISRYCSESAVFRDLTVAYELKLTGIC